MIKDISQKQDELLIQSFNIVRIIKVQFRCSYLLTAHLEASAAFEPQFTPSPRTIIAEFLRATIAKESEIVKIICIYWC